MSSLTNKAEQIIELLETVRNEIKRTTPTLKKVTVRRGPYKDKPLLSLIERSIQQASSIRIEIGRRDCKIKRTTLVQLWNAHRLRTAENAPWKDIPRLIGKKITARDLERMYHRYRPAFTYIKSLPEREISHILSHPFVFNFIKERLEVEAEYRRRAQAAQRETKL